MNRNKVRGMVIGGAIGDALGMPVETWSPEKIREIHPNGVRQYLTPKDHKWYDAEKTPAGTTTDDTQLTIATMNGFIEAQDYLDPTCMNLRVMSDLYLTSIAREHDKAMKVTDAGWGNTTREAVRRLINGVHWSQSGFTNDPSRGTGNGVPMKCSPLAAWFLSPAASKFSNDRNFSFHNFCVKYSAMTHYSRMSAHACVNHVDVMMLCLMTSPQDSCMLNVALTEIVCVDGEHKYDVSYLNDQADNINDRMLALRQLQNALPEMTQSDIIREFGNGSCYVYDSLPFSYAWFMKDHSPTFQILYQVIEAGGDTDTNAKIVGEMLGALHGYESIKTYLPWAIDGLIEHDSLLAVADKFCDTFKID